MKEELNIIKSLNEGPLLVSACLLGEACRYDGGHCRHQGVLDLCRGREIVPICPETMGGLPRPRSPAEIAGGDGDDVLAGRARVIDREGNDLTAEFIQGAEEALRLAKENGARQAILKERSPSCGTGWIYDGSFSGRKITGRGVAAAMLASQGIELRSEDLIST